MTSKNNKEAYLTASSDTHLNSLREPIGYICPNYREESFGGYTRFCGHCGTEMPSKLRLQATGLVTFAWDYGMVVRDPEAINEFLAKVGETRYWLQAYRPTFRASEIRFCEHLDGLATHSLSCVWTERLNVPIGSRGWVGVMQLSGGSDPGFFLRDPVNEVEIQVGSVLLFDVVRAERSAW